MIRRDARLADGSPAWVLVSQIEHARLSAALAERCEGRFTAPKLKAVRRELLLAVRHHDDGWAEWDAVPRIDTEHGRPVSFMELETGEGIEIWNRSIERAAVHGPLAGWLVAGHFIRLIEKYSEHADDAPVANWLTTTESRRAAWLAQWHAADAALHTRALADEALQWLWTLDESSLWLCCAAPIEAAEFHAPTDTAGASIVGRGAPLEMSLSGSRPQALSADPWRFTAPTIALQTPAIVVPAVRIDSAQQLGDRARRAEIRWSIADAPTPA
jgi:hypothetical protein